MACPTQIAKEDVEGTHRLTLWMYFRLTSSFKTCATESDEIFSRAERAWILHREKGPCQFTADCSVGFEWVKRERTQPW